MTRLVLAAALVLLSATAFAQTRNQTTPPARRASPRG